LTTGKEPKKSRLTGTKNKKKKKTWWNMAGRGGFLLREETPGTYILCPPHQERQDKKKTTKGWPGNIKRGQTGERTPRSPTGQGTSAGPKVFRRPSNESARRKRAGEQQQKVRALVRGFCKTTGAAEGEKGAAHSPLLSKNQVPENGRRTQER